MDPRFTTGTYKTLLSAIGIWVDSKSISIDEVFDSEGIASRTMSVNVSQNNIEQIGEQIGEHLSEFHIKL